MPKVAAAISLATSATLLFGVSQPAQQVGAQLHKAAILLCTIFLFIRPIQDCFLTEQVVVIAKLDHLRKVIAASNMCDAWDTTQGDNLTLRPRKSSTCGNNAAKTEPRSLAVKSPSSAQYSSKVSRSSTCTRHALST